MNLASLPPTTHAPLFTFALIVLKFTFEQYIVIVRVTITKTNIQK